MNTLADLIEQWASRVNLTDWQRQANRYKNRCVYILESKGFYKIGKTQNLSVRIKSLQVGNPFGLNIAHVIFTDYHTKVERALHLIFGDSHTGNEWFNLSLKEISTIKSMDVEGILSWANSLRPVSQVQPETPKDQMTFNWKEQA